MKTWHVARTQSSLEQELREATTAEALFDLGTRGAYSTDASNYRQVPQGVVIARTIDHVVTAVEICRRHRVPLASRGEGTSLAGQAVNRGVVIDFSKSLNRVVSIDPQERVARVEPGCNLDSLRAAAEEHGLTFGPGPATHDRNTIGEMIGNTSCGAHSVMSDLFGPGPPTAEPHVRHVPLSTHTAPQAHLHPAAGIPSLRHMGVPRPRPHRIAAVRRNPRTTGRGTQP